MPFAQLDFAVMSSLEVGFTAPGGDLARSLLPCLLQASFSSLPVPNRVVLRLNFFAMYLQSLPLRLRQLCKALEHIQ